MHLLGPYRRNLVEPGNQTVQRNSQSTTVIRAHSMISIIIVRQNGVIEKASCGACVAPVPESLSMATVTVLRWK